MIKQRKDSGICEEKRKSNIRKNNNIATGNKPESTVERRKIKEISTKGKTIETIRTISKQRKKILSTTTWRRHENIPTTGCKRNRIIFD